MVWGIGLSCVEVVGFSWQVFCSRRCLFKITRSRERLRGRRKQRLWFLGLSGRETRCFPQISCPGSISMG